MINWEIVGSDWVFKQGLAYSSYIYGKQIARRLDNFAKCLSAASIEYARECRIKQVIFGWSPLNNTNQ